MNSSEVLGIIPARGGSKGLKYKNLRILYEKPLIWYAINAGKKSCSISRLVCSTDDEQIVDICKNHDLETIIRPKELAQDNTRMIDVLRHALKILYENGCYLPEYVVRLQPTNPFIMPDQIDQLIKLMQVKPQAKSGQTVVKVPHQFHAYNQRTVSNGWVKYHLKSKKEKHHNRQLKPPLYGSGNLCVTKSDIINNGHSHFSEPSIAFEIEPVYGLDIDTEEDLELAEYYLSKRIVSVP